MHSDSLEDNLLTPELLGWLAAGERGMVAGFLFPYVHRAVMTFRIRRYLSGEETEDLEGEAFLYVLGRLQKMFDGGNIERFSSHLVYLMVRNCYVEKKRDREGRESAHTHYNAMPSETLERDASYADHSHKHRERQIETRQALRAALIRLEPEDRETLDLFEQHYFLCEDRLGPEKNINDPDTIKSVRAEALRHLALSLHVNMSTVYRRLNRAGERLRDLLDDRARAGGNSN